MARSLRDIRRKMKAIKSTSQVTKAMELVAASKMRKAVQNAQMLRHYALSAWRILQSIAKTKGQANHSFLEQRPVKNVLGIIFTSDRGLCGSLNAQLFRTTSQYLKGLKDIKGFENIDFITVGKKGHQFLTRQGQTVIATFPALSNNPRYKDILPITKLAIDSFKDGTYSHVVLIYTNFISPLVQEASAKVLLPFSESDLQKMVLSLTQNRRITKEEIESREHEDVNIIDYAIEPSPEEVLEIILPQLAQVQVYQAVLESVASEHSARMVAMRNATDNAKDILDDLTLTYNQTRQANITAELAELSASKAALD